MSDSTKIQKMENFKSKPFRKFLYSHTRLNNYIKVSIVAVDFLYKSKEDHKELSTLINTLILEAGERWTPRIINNPTEELIKIKNDLSKTGIIWAYSAFDVFFKQVEGQLSSYFKSVEGTENSKEENEEEDKDSQIIRFYKKLDWSIEKIKPILPVFKFYTILRHCVAHNMGFPNGKLISISQSGDFINAISDWETKYVRKKISNPPHITNEEIELKPHHSIMYSETCLRIATDINERMFEKLGLNNFIRLTIKSHLTDPSVLTIPYCENFSRYIVFHLKNDYGIDIPLYKDIYKFYDNNEPLMREHKQRYLTLKKNS